MLLEPPSVYLKEYALVDEASDSVRVFVGANHECVALLCYDKAIEPCYNSFHVVW